MTWWNIDTALWPGPKNSDQGPCEGFHRNLTKRPECPFTEHHHHDERCLDEVIEGGYIAVEMTEYEHRETEQFGTCTLQLDQYNGYSYLVGKIVQTEYYPRQPGDLNPRRIKKYLVNVKPI